MARSAGIGASTAAVDDTIDPLTVDFLRVEVEAELFAHHPSEEAADRVLLPMGRAHDGSNRRRTRRGSPDAVKVVILVERFRRSRVIA